MPLRGGQDEDVHDIETVDMDGDGQGDGRRDELSDEQDVDEPSGQAHLANGLKAGIGPGVGTGSGEIGQLEKDYIEDQKKLIEAEQQWEVLKAIMLEGVDVMREEREAIKRATQGSRRRMEGEAPKLCPFMTVEPEGLCQIQVEGKWEKVRLYVDSGATETVIGESILGFVELREGLAFIRGVKYEVANGIRIPNLGERSFVGTSEEGFKRQLAAQVCEVNKNLLSVRKITKAGNRVVFDEDGSYIEDKQTGEKMWLEEEGGMYAIDLWVETGF